MIKVNKDVCIGCGACQAMVPEVFEIDDDGLAFVMDDAKISENKTDVEEAIENCPTGAISMTE